MSNYAQQGNDVWAAFDAEMRASEERIAPLFRAGTFTYVHPARLCASPPARGLAAYSAEVAYVEWGPSDAPTVLCLGGIANSARRFDYVALALRERYRVLAIDWLGRGRSEWLRDQGDYSYETCVEQIRQAIEVLGLTHATLIGSSLGGSVGMTLLGERPDVFRSLFLNDVGPFIPYQRRMHRAQRLEQHYVFKSPADLLRRVGASQKHDGPLQESVLKHNAFHLTQWSQEDGGRIYRHDLRAMKRYAEQAAQNVDQWGIWERLSVPTLVFHGMESDALLAETVERMGRRPGTTIVHIAATGHTPALADPKQIGTLASWLESYDSVPSGTILVPDTRSEEFR
jgi:pimeloyl-ACP methyl ester carboxylesterase